MPKYLCIDDGGHRVSLEVGKEYEGKPTMHSLLRIWDESQEAYLYPARLFKLVGENDVKVHDDS